MKTKKLKLKDKKVSPSVYFFVPIIVCLMFIGLYTYDTFSHFEVVNNYIKLPVSNEYEVVRTVAYESNTIDMSKYVFTSSEPVMEEPEIEEEVIPVVETPVVEPVVEYVPLHAREPIVDASVEAILAEYNLTVDEFYTVVAVVAAEGGGSYVDAYAVINTIYNRANCQRWINAGNNIGLDGTSLYTQVILPSQFSVYASGSYLNHMYETGTNAYNATVTLLSTRDRMHAFMSFRSSNSGASGTQFIEGGNIYFSNIC